MKEQIQQLISEGRTEEALVLLAQQSSDALLLQARYNAGKKQYNMGLIEFSEWGRVQAQINYAALELAESGHKKTTGASPAPVAPPAPPPAGGKKAFISYNHGDAAVARQVKEFLAKNDVDVIIDEEDMPAGMSIMEFIQESIKRCDSVVSIVSAKSLNSGWVGQESVASMYAVWLADKKFIPVKLDNVVFDSKFQIVALKALKEKITTTEADIAEIKSLGSSARNLEDDCNRFYDLLKNLDSILQRLKSVLMVDISEDTFQPGMQKVLKRIQE
ncbi:MAG: toll/interleukin-1 receptor domain-containing protein [Lewinellaceae bacterium]|nr:toll/interleukin-1 receptor domain-containing protein [Lewinellaceae bacterium]